MPGILDTLWLMENAPEVSEEVAAGGYIDYTALPDPEKKTPSKLVSFLPFALGALFILWLVKRK